MNNTEINIGIDTSKHQLDIAVRPSGEFFSVDNTQDGINHAVLKLLPIKPDRVLIEATGRFELPFACAAFKAGLPIVTMAKRLNPN